MTSGVTLGRRCRLNTSESRCKLGDGPDGSEIDDPKVHVTMVLEIHGDVEENQDSSKLLVQTLQEQIPYKDFPNSGHTIVATHCCFG